MFDINLKDSGEARRWKQNVEAELKEVSRVLILVAQECEERPEEEDSILRAIMAVGGSLTSAWTALDNCFDGLISALNDILNAIQVGVEEQIDKWNAFKEKIGF